MQKVEARQSSARARVTISGVADGARRCLAPRCWKQRMVTLAAIKSSRAVDDISAEVPTHRQIGDVSRITKAAGQPVT